MPVYLIHLNEPMHHARHYIGFVSCLKNLEPRLNHHRGGSGSRFLAAVNRAGIEYHVVRVWTEADRHTERRIKNRKKAKLMCPLCNPLGYLSHENGGIDYVCFI